MKLLMIVPAVFLLAITATAETRILTVTMDIAAPIERTWEAWTTPEGIQSFFAPDGQVEPEVDGSYDVYFYPDRDPGQRGAEGMRILCFEPMNRFSFTWSAPISMPEIRKQRTLVVLEFSKVDDEHTTVQFTHLGWGEGALWDEAYDYFNEGWKDYVLPRFRYAVENGPVDWHKLPTLEPVAKSLKAKLVVE